MFFHTYNQYIFRFISAKAARHASSETQATLNAANMGSAVVAVVCAAWVADVVALVDAVALIIAVNASSIVSPVLIKRKYQNAHAHMRVNIYRDITFEYLYITMLASVCALYQGCRYVQANSFQSTDKYDPNSLPYCFVFVFLRLISFVFFF